MAQSQASKRKDAPAPSQEGPVKAPVKRLKTIEARKIHVQPSDKALNERKELDVASFVKSRESEIRALEAAISNSRTALAARAFQQVPPQLRRRTASHNVKKVPSRLRTRAAREMKEDKTPTGAARRKEPSGKQRLRSDIAQERRAASDMKDATVGQLTDSSAPFLASGEAHGPQILVRKFKKRQLQKSWLPTHMFHAKRAHMTPPLAPLWRFAIPLTPTEKCYRLSHRASSLRGCIAWDMSYMNTILLRGPEQSLVKLLHALSVSPKGELAAKWMRGLRSWSGWVHERDNDQRPVAPVTILWDPGRLEETSRRLLIRIHPSAFLHFWQEVQKLAKMQRPTVTVHDLRFEIGSIEISGPAAMESLVRVLHPTNPDSSISKNWPSLAAVTSVKALPSNAVLGLSTTDPRLRTLGLDRSTAGSTKDEELLQFLATWPLDARAEEAAFDLLDTDHRARACQQMMSQKSVNRRRSAVLPGDEVPALSTDPSIPLIIYTLQQNNQAKAGGSCILLLPWKYVLPFWYAIMHTPLASGGQPRFGGLREQRQQAFEANSPWFPGDFPGTTAGWAWELREREQRKADWAKRPKTKRIQWEALDLGRESKGEIGRGWACDWEFLVGKSGVAETSSTEDDGSKEKNPMSEPPPGLRQTLWVSKSPPPKQGLAAVSISFLNRGHATTCARIYRFPTTDIKLRASWQALALGRGHKSLAARSSAASSTTKDAHLPVPPSCDLVGFVTTGNYHLGEGQATAIGSILVDRLIHDSATIAQGGRLSGLCIVRDAGVNVGRLARWEGCA